MNKKGIRGFLYKILCGFLLGLSIVAPGISGSVIAVMMGIYDELITIVANPFKKLKQNILYLIPMGIGAVISVVLFVLLFKYLFDNYPTPTFFLFIALVIGSFPSIYKKTKQEVFKSKFAVFFVLALIVSIVLAFMNQYYDDYTLLNQLLNHKVVDSVLTTSNIFYLCLCGFIAGLVSIVPGMSVSIILMVLGVYTSLMTAASELNIYVIIPVGISFVIGMMLFSKVVKFVFDKYNTIGFYAVFGFMIGSVFGILPELPKNGGEWLLSILMLGVGAFLAILLSYAGKKLNVED